MIEKDSVREATEAKDKNEKREKVKVATVVGEAVGSVERE